MQFKSKWERESRARGARPVMWTLLTALTVIAAGGALRMLPGDDAAEGSQTVGLQPLIAIEEHLPRVTSPAEINLDAALRQTDKAADAFAPPAEAVATRDTRSPGLPEPSQPIAQSAAAADADATLDELPTFDGRPIRPVRTVNMLVTAYSPDAASCAPFDDGITASGYSVYTNGGNLVAADTSLLPMGTLVSVPGYNDGLPVPVLDRGGAIKGNRLDVLYPTHNRALQWGAQRIEVVVWEYAD